MKKIISLFVLILCITIPRSIAGEPDFEVVNRYIIYNSKRVTHQFPLLSYNGITYLSVRDVAQLINRNVRWEENYNQIFLDSKKEQAIRKEETAEKIGKAIIEEFYSEKIIDTTAYYTCYLGNTLNLNDAFALAVIFNPDESHGRDGLYMLTNCDVQISIDSNDGSISVFERQEDGDLKEFSLIELSNRKAILDED